MMPIDTDSEMLQIPQRVPALAPIFGMRLVDDYDDPRPAQGFATQKDLNAAYAELLDTMDNYGLLMESADFQDVDDYYNPGEEEVPYEAILEAVVIQKYSLIENKMHQFQRMLAKMLPDKVSEGSEPIVGKPKRSGQFAYVTVQFPFTDGQTLSIVFHAPEGDKTKITPNDTLVAFRWLLNKRDITHIVAPENGQEISYKQVFEKVSQLVDKNSEHFQKTQKSAQEEKQKLEALKTENAEAEKNQELLMGKTEALDESIKTLDAKIANAQTRLQKQKTINAELQAKLDSLKAAIAQKQAAKTGAMQQTTDQNTGNATSNQTTNTTSPAPANPEARGYSVNAISDSIDSVLAKLNDPAIRSQIDAGILAELEKIKDQVAKATIQETLKNPTANEIDPSRHVSPADAGIRIPNHTLPESARYELVEADDIQASHLPENGFKPNPNYYTLENERRYHEEEGSQKKVLENAKMLEPDFVLKDSVDANNGAPVVDQENMVLGGNGRIMSLKLAYQNGGRVLENYKTALKKRLVELGIDPSKVDSMKQPILVRRITTKYSKAERQALVSAMNDTYTASKDTRMSGKTRGDRLGTKSLDLLAVGLSADGDVRSLREFFDTPASVRCVESLISDGVINEQERNALLTPDGLLNPDGKTAVENALRARISSNSYESLAKIPPDISTKLDTIIPSILISENIGGDWNLSGYLKEAMDILAEYYRSNSCSNNDFNGFLTTKNLRGATIEPAPRNRYSKIAQKLFVLLLTTKKKDISNRFYFYAHDAQKAAQNNGNAFVTPLTAEQSAKKNLGINLQTGGNTPTATVNPAPNPEPTPTPNPTPPPEATANPAPQTTQPESQKTEQLPDYMKDVQDIIDGKYDANDRTASKVLRAAISKSKIEGKYEKFSVEINSALDRLGNIAKKRAAAA